PVLAQAPVFIGLFHVLRSFNRTGTGFGQLGLTPEENRELSNYAFNVADVQSFLDARLFGAPISAWITMPQDQLNAFAVGPDATIPSTWVIVAVSVPLMIVAAIMTHMNSRASVARQSEAAAANPQSAIMNKLALYVFPLGVLVFGALLPVAILLYWVSNNTWTYAQQHLVFGKIDKEEAAKAAAAVEKRSENAPKPGVKPVSTTKPKPGARPKLSKMTPTSDTSTAETGEGISGPTTGAATPAKPRPQANRNKSTKRKRR
ncbi:MAG: membrane protein insertase YidC, partial [Rhodococcus sp. (in: high G+C Gram-positive bacteria)]